MKRFTALLVFGLAITHNSATEIWYAWWLTATFEPKDAEIEGIPLRSLDRAWVSASALREEMFPSESQQPGGSVADHGGSLSLLVDLDGDKKPERALVGVYQDKSGQRGRFLLVLGQGRGGRWRKRALFEEPGQAGFSVLFTREGHLEWYTCMECDSVCKVAVKDGTWKLECDACSDCA